jgi:hypothetical protein
LLDIDFLKFDELDRDPLVESIKNLWATELDNNSYFIDVFVDEMERQMAQIMSQWLDELSAQNVELFYQRDRGLDSETNIFYDETPNYIVERKQGDDHFFRLELHVDNGYTIDMIQEGFYAYGYRVGVGGSNSISITQQ